jgi:hypothetical protein
LKTLTEQIVELFSFKYNRIYKTVLAIIGSYVLIPIQISENLIPYLIFGAPFVLCFYGLFNAVIKGIVDIAFTQSKDLLILKDKVPYDKNSNSFLERAMSKFNGPTIKELDLNGIEIDTNKFSERISTIISNNICILCFSIFDILIILPKDYFSWK